MTDGATARKERERAYHDARYADETRLRARKYYDVDAGQHRYRRLVTTAPAGRRILEYGCGTGSLAFDLAAAGADVVGIDISTAAIEAARARADVEGSTAAFVEMDAEALLFDDDSFDLVCGTGILHHLDLTVALPEVARVLRPSGQAVFRAPRPQPGDQRLPPAHPQHADQR